MRNDQQTVNGLTAYVLGLSHTDVPLYIGVDYQRSATAYFDVQIAVRHADGTETTLLAWTQFASRATSGSGYQTYNFSCPQTTLSATDAVVVRLRARNSGGSAVAEFITEQLGAGQLPSATWNFYIYTEASVSKYGSSAIIYWGDPAHNTRIENFQWTPAITKAWHDVASWSFQLLTRKWNNISTFTLTLQTRAWYEVCSSIFQLMVKTWNTITSWAFNLITETWHEIATWIFQLQTQKWHDIIEWMFELATKKWNSIAYWTWQTITYGWHTITEWTFSLITHGWHDIITWIFTIETTIGKAFPFIILIGGIFTVAIAFFIIFKH
jgi:hypothetical protein